MSEQWLADGLHVVDVKVYKVAEILHSLNALWCLCLALLDLAFHPPRARVDTSSQRLVQATTLKVGKKSC